MPIAGTHFVVDDAYCKKHEDYVVYPDTPLLRDSFRHQWIMRRNKRPFTPKPHNTPMPDREANVEDRARLYSVYLRPWVLDQLHADGAVPHITELDAPLAHGLPEGASREGDKRRRLSSKTCQGSGRQTLPP